MNDANDPRTPSETAARNARPEEIPFGSTPLARDLIRGLAQFNGELSQKPPPAPILRAEFVIPSAVCFDVDAFPAALEAAWQEQFRRFVAGMIAHPATLRAYREYGLGCQIVMGSLTPLKTVHPDANPTHDPSKPMKL